MKIALIGAGRHSLPVLDAIEEGKQFQIGCIVVREENPVLPEDRKMLREWPFLEESRLRSSGIRHGVVAIGDPIKRREAVRSILDQVPEFEFVSIVHPSAILGRGAVAGPGSVVLANTVLGPGARLGKHVLINTSASVDHDCRIEDFGTISPGCVLGGDVVIGGGAFVGLGARIIQGVHVGEQAVVGAGAVVVSDFPARKVGYGVPCRVVRERLDGEAIL